MTNPCYKCKHHELKGEQHRCNKKHRLTSTARISGDKGSHKLIDCFESK